MKNISRRNFVGQAAILTGCGLFLQPILSVADTHAKQRTSYRLLRHATLLLEINNKKILVDPMLSKKDALEPVANAANTSRIPMADMPLTDAELEQLLDTVDAVLVTHTHRDHWDIAAQEKLPKNKLIFCQPADEEKIEQEGFTNVVKIDESVVWHDITIYRTNGQHGTGETGKKMGTVSGYVLVHKNHRIYIAGDTIWCSDVQDAISKHKPTHIIVNGGGAQFLQGDPITMTINDVLQLAAFTRVPVEVVHLESVNHCYQKRNDFRTAINAHALEKQINIPDDGDIVELS